MIAELQPFPLCAADSGSFSWPPPITSPRDDEEQEGGREKPGDGHSENTTGEGPAPPRAPRKSCRDCRQSEKSTKGDRRFLVCGHPGCSGGFTGYQASLCSAPAKFCTLCLSRRYGYAPAEMEMPGFTCPLCDDTKSACSAPVRQPSKSHSQHRQRDQGRGGMEARRSREGALKKGGQKRRQSTPLAPLLTVGTAVVTGGGLKGTVVGAANGYFQVRLPGGGTKKLRGTALHLEREGVASEAEAEEVEEEEEEEEEEVEEEEVAPPGLGRRRRGQATATEVVRWLRANNPAALAQAQAALRS